MITGLFDMTEISVRYVLTQDRLIFHFRILNATKFLLENLQFELQTPSSLLVSRNRYTVRQLSTREATTWSVAGELRDFSQCTCQLRISLEAPEGASHSQVVMHSAPFGIALADQLTPDFSLSHVPMRFEYLFAQLDFSIVTTVAQPFSDAKRQLSLRLALILDTEEKLGFAAVTRCGNRLLIALNTKRQMEVRSDSREVINTLRSHLEVSFS